MLVIVPLFVPILPTFIAIARRRPRLGKFFLLNLLLAPTCIGWLVMLIKALSANTTADVPDVYKRRKAMRLLLAARFWSTR